MKIKGNTGGPMKTGYSPRAASKRGGGSSRVTSGGSTPASTPTKMTYGGSLNKKKKMKYGGSIKKKK